MLDRHLDREPGGAIAFDGDGTLWSGDIGEDFFEALLERGSLSEAAHVALTREAAFVQMSADGDAVSLARRIHAAYLVGSFPEERACEIMTWAFASWSVADVEAFAKRVLDEVAIGRRFHGEALGVLDWARRRNVPVYLVSASPRAVVQEAARRIGIDTANVVSATEERDENGYLKASVERPIPYGEGKVTNLRAKLGERPLYAAFGDNAFDIPMLLEARVPVAIRPKPRLAARAAEVPNLILLERGESSLDRRS